MSKTFGQDDPALLEYALKTFKPSDAILAKIRKTSKDNGLPEIQVGDMDGLHLEVITRATNAKKIVEIGTLGGYSGACFCRGMGPEGKLFTFEISEKNAEVAKLNFADAGVLNQVEIHVGPASLNLPRISKQGPFDIVFIDADKTGYPDYLAWAAENLKVGGLVLGDNTFAWGTIADESPDIGDKPTIEALRTFNSTCASGGRFRATILPTNEGLTMAVKIR